MADVVPVAEVRDPQAVELAEVLADRHRVGEGLQRVRAVGEAVDDWHRCVCRELLDFGLVERADQDRADESRQHERRVSRALAPG